MDSDAAEIARRALGVAKATALGITGDREAAADVAQEVAIVAVQKASSLRDPKALDAWLHRVAVRRALAQVRRTNARRAAERAHHDIRALEPGDERIDGALELLSGLAPRQRAALTLRYVHDLPDAAIAKALGCRPATVRSLLARGRTAIRARHAQPTECVR